MRTRRRPFITLTVLASVLAPTLGCGSGDDQLPRAEVTGTATLDGEPIPAATLLFRPASGRSGRGKVENGVIIEASTYGINDGIVLGTHKIAVQPIPDVAPVTMSRMEDPANPEKSMRPLPSYAKQAPQPKAKRVDIPAKYRDPVRSGLTATIVEGGNKLSLELTTE